jgi:hypothetical protein
MAATVVPAKPCPANSSSAAEAILRRVSAARSARSGEVYARRTAGAEALRPDFMAVNNIR